MSQLRNALSDLLSYVEAQRCEHDDTHRGGAIWTICSWCGKKWADDEGGFKPDAEPMALANARKAIERFDREAS